MSTVKGRDQDLRAVRDALALHGACTLVGPGGVGKSTVVAELVAGTANPTLVLDAGSADQAIRVLDRLAEAIDVDLPAEAPDQDPVALGARLGARLAATDLALVVVDHADADVDVDNLVVGLRAASTRCGEVGLLLVTRVHAAQPLGQTVLLRPLDLGRGTDATSPARQVFAESFIRAGGDPALLRQGTELVDRLVVQTGGLPLALVALASRASVVGLEAAVESAIPPAGEGGDPVEATLSRSLADLDPTCQMVFEAIGLLRGRASADVVAAVSDMDRDRAMWAVEQLARRSLVTAGTGGVDMLPPLRRLARRQANEHGRRALMEARLVQWAHRLCSQVPPARTADVLDVADDLTSAVEMALRDGSLEVAVAIAAVLDDAWRADLRHHRRLEVLGPLLVACRDAADATPPTVPEEVVINLLRLAAMASAEAVGQPAGMPFLDEAAARARAHGGVTRQSARLASLRAGWAFEAGELDSAAEQAERSILAGAEAGDDLARLRSVKLLADVELERGDLARARHLAVEALREAPSTMGWLRSYATATIGACELERGAPALALAAARQVHAAGADSGDVDLVLEADWLTAMADPALPPLSGAALTDERAGRSIIHLQADVARAIRLLAAGDAASAITLAADCEVRATALPMQPLAIDARLLVGEAAVVLGEPVEAVRAFRHALGDAVAGGNRLRVPEALDGLADLVDDVVADTLRAAAAIIRDHLGAASRPKPWRAASVPRGAGPVDWVRAGTLTPEGLKAVLDVASIPTRLRRGGPLEALSPAEMVVADLVTAGLTNRAIAERLHVSRRTVETHIAHAFQKLGVSTRTQLARAVLSSQG